MYSSQIPRLYAVYKQQGTIENFQQLLDNIFRPLFEVTLDPASHPHLHMFLKTVVGFDMASNKSVYLYKYYVYSVYFFFVL